MFWLREEFIHTGPNFAIFGNIEYTMFSMRKYSGTLKKKRAE